MPCSRTFSCAGKQLYEGTRNFLSETERTSGYCTPEQGDHILAGTLRSERVVGQKINLRLCNERFGLSRRRTTHHQAGIANFVNHGAIADLQSLRGLAPVPMIGTQCFDDGVA